MPKINGLTNRQRLMVDLLPEYQWKINLAGRAAGFSKSYSNDRLPAVARNNIVLSRAIEAKRLDLAQKSELTHKLITERLNRIAERCEKTDKQAAIRANELLGKHIGYFESDNSQRAGLTINVAPRSKCIDSIDRTG